MKIVTLLFVTAALHVGAVDFNVRDVGAVGGGQAKDTTAIQRTIDAAAAAGGGRVVVPPGRYVSGTLYLKDGVELHLAEGAELFASPDAADYNLPDVFVQNPTSRVENNSGAHLIMAIERRKVAITGKGTINGNSPAFLVDADGYAYPYGKIPWRPGQMVFFAECEDVRLEGVSLRDSPYWSCFLYGCTNVAVKNVSISTQRDPLHTPNGDGLDIDCCQHVRVSGCRISTADDSITLRADGRRLKRARDCADVEVADCELSSACNAIRIGVGSGVVSNAVFRRIRIANTRNVVNIVPSWSAKTRGVDVRDILFDDFDVEAIMFCHLYRKFPGDSVVTGLRFRNIRGTVRCVSDVAGSEKNPFSDIAFEDCMLTGGVDVRHVTGFSRVGGILEQVALTDAARTMRDRTYREATRRFWYRQTPLVLAARGRRARYTVVIAQNASEAIRYAADELVAFVERSTGVRLPIVTDAEPLPERAIVLGKIVHRGNVDWGHPRWDSLGEEGFQLLASMPHLNILANSDRGVLYGVYEFLEQFAGVRWYARDCEVVPPRETLSVPGELDQVHTPAFAARMAYWREALGGDFAARLRLNGNEASLREKHGGNPNHFDPLLGNCHTFDKLLPSKEFFDAHPEYFSEVRGRRLRDSTQLCLTNPEVLDRVTEKVLEQMRKNGNVKYFGVSQNDWLNHCTCATCRAVDEAEGSPAGSLIRFVNAVAERTEKEFPNKIIQTLAYEYTQKPPKTAPRHNVIPCLCPVRCEFATPIAEGRTEINRRFRDDFAGWGKISKRMMVWDYGVDFYDYLLPFPNLRTLQANMRFYRDNHVVYMFEQASYNTFHSSFSDLKVWLCAKWMWNPDMPLDTLLNDFLPGYYHAAAPWVREYLDALHALDWTGTTRPLILYEDYKVPTYTDAFLARMDGVWRKAEAAVKDDPVALDRVRFAAMGIDFTRFMRETDRTMRDIMVARRTERYAPTALARELAGRLDERLQRMGKTPFRFAESGARDKNVRTRIARCLSGVEPINDSAVVRGTILRLFNRNKGAEYTWDSSTTNKWRLVKIWPTDHSRDARLYLNTIGYDQGESYRFRLRVRAPKSSPEACGPAFVAGVWDLDARQDVVRRSFEVAELKDGYAWYELPEWRPTDKQYLWICAGGEGTAKAPVSDVWISEIGIDRR